MVRGGAEISPGALGQVLGSSQRWQQGLAPADPDLLMIGRAGRGGHARIKWIHIPGTISSLVARCIAGGAERGGRFGQRMQHKPNQIPDIPLLSTLGVLRNFLWHTL